MYLYNKPLASIIKNIVIACFLHDGTRVLASNPGSIAVAHLPKSGEALALLVAPSPTPLDVIIL